MKINAYIKYVILKNCESNVICKYWNDRGIFIFFFFFTQKTAYDRESRDWSSDVCSSNLQLIYIVSH